ncbi:tetratricopeptide repeat protein [Myroides indicus]|uniref:Tetratricopeptide repeat protein n=1 Tax=Myroides indicus TaxID=1323422 RepID=A0A4R7EP22_9FLAO|nr:tetratricopeptide repeat protein [Myroides indicus]TDS51240.1 tetratricopeptide repeat protein [Myroides indicus]
MKNRKNKIISIVFLVLLILSIITLLITNSTFLNSLYKTPENFSKKEEIVYMDSLLNYNLSEAETNTAELFKKALNSKNKYELMYGYYYKMAVDIRKNRLDSILYYADQVFSYVDNNKYIEAKTNHLLGRYYTIISAYPKSLEAFLKAKNFFEKEKDNKQLMAIYNDLGGLYLYLYEDEKAYYFLNKAYELAKEENDLRYKGIYYANMSNFYKEEEEYEKAIEALEEVLSTFNILHDTVTIVRAYKQLGETHFAMQQLEKAEEYYDKAYRLSLDTDDKFLQVPILLNYGRIYEKKGDRNRAVKFYKDALDLADEEGFFREELSVLLALTTFYENQNDYKLGNMYLKQYYQVKDSINGVKVSQRLDELRWSNVLKEKDLEQEIAQQRHKNQNYLYSITIMSTLFVVVFILFLYRNKNKSLYISKIENKRLEEKVLAEQEVYKLQAERHEQELKAKNELQVIKAKQYEFELKSNKELQELRSQQYELEMEAKNRELTTINVQLLAKNRLLDEIESIFKDIPKDKLTLFDSLSQVIRSNRDQEKDWQSFKEIFRKIHPDFFKMLRFRYPDLTKTEIRICTYIKMKMENNEIAGLLNISYQSLITTRYRIRKKMKLERTDDLDEFIQYM